MSDTDATQARRDVAADVDEIIEHIINANMLSMPYDVYAELFDAVDGLGVEIEKLEAENTKLRTQLADVTVSVGRVEERCAKLRVECDEWHRVAVSKQDIIDHMRDANAENARLLELLHALAFCADDSADCDKCPMNGGPCGEVLQAFCDKMAGELRKLGIEVNV